MMNRKSTTAVSVAEKQDTENREPGEVQAVIKTLAILEILADRGEMSLTDLAACAGSHKSTIYRFMCTLTEKGYVRRNPENECYSLTLKLFQVGMCTYGKIDLMKTAEPILKRLALVCEETVHLAIHEDNHLIYLSKIESSHILRVSMRSKVGSTAPEYCTGVGKVLLAWADPAYLEQYLARCEFRKFTEHTIVDRLHLAAELQTIRNQGWAYDNEEHECGVRCAAAPVRDYYGKVIAAISASGPTVRLDDEKLARLRECVIAASEELSQNLGSTTIPIKK